MNNLYAWIIILLGSIMLGTIKYYSAKFRKGRAYKFNEFFNHAFNIFLGGTILYYFISIRYLLIIEEGTINLMDFILFLIFVMCILGHFPYFIKNITDGINGIIKGILNK